LLNADKFTYGKVVAHIRLKETFGAWILDSIQLTGAGGNAGFLGVRESLSFMVVYY
jgi:hypothetical protein